MQRKRKARRLEQVRMLRRHLHLPLQSRPLRWWKALHQREVRVRERKGLRCSSLPRRCVEEVPRDGLRLRMRAGEGGHPRLRRHPDLRPEDVRVQRRKVGMPYRRRNSSRQVGQKGMPRILQLQRMESK